MKIENKKYKIIYADPPWRFEAWSSKGKEKSADKHYETMSFEDIKNLKIEELAERDCILFLWAIYPMLPHALEVIKEWGFTYKTVAFTWVKKRNNEKFHVGLGYWTRGNPELCLLATKGKPKRISKKVRNLTITKLKKHSEKPPIIRQKIVELVGDLPRIELFSRNNIEGWDCWGNEIPNTKQKLLNVEKN